MITFFLFGEMRSGNHFLIDLLSSTGKIRIRTRYDVTDESYTEIDIDKLKQLKRDKPIGICPLHTSKPHLAFLPNLFKALGYYPKCVWLTRRDKIEQAVSIIRASKTQVYSIHGGSTEERRKLNQLEIDINEDDLLRQIARCFFADQVIETFCIRHGITPYKIFYEDLLDEMNLERNIAKLLDFLSIRYKLPLSLNSSVEMQRSKNSAELYPEFIEYLYKRLRPEYLPFKL